MMKDPDSHYQDAVGARLQESLDSDTASTCTMLQLLDHALPDPDENVGIDPYNSI